MGTLGEREEHVSEMSHTRGKEERYYHLSENYSWGHEVLGTCRLAVVGLRESPRDLQKMLLTVLEPCMLRDTG